MLRKYILRVVGIAHYTPAKIIVSVAICIALLMLVFPAAAQNNAVTYDDVIRVAGRMYCPICENEPLDQCRNTTCMQWKDEIRRQLAAGRSDDEIINYFVERYGQHVVGVPRDPLLRFLAFVAPIVGTLLALGLGFMTFRRWQQNTPTKTKVSPLDDAPPMTNDDYRTRLERDVRL